uniref:Uncharacterized protein n=1 Tax=Arundo donax TaxID=35708 RepID=A0A0A9APY7_ARUDO
MLDHNTVLRSISQFPSNISICPVEGCFVEDQLL